MQLQTLGSKIDCAQCIFEEWPFYDLKSYGSKPLAAVIYSNRIFLAKFLEKLNKIKCTLNLLT